MSDLSLINDEQLARATRKLSRAGWYLALITIVFFTLGVWVDLRWFLMTLLSGALATVAFISASVGSDEIRKRNPDFKWDQ